MAVGQRINERIPAYAWSTRKGYIPLPAEDEADLITRWQQNGDLAARNKLLDAFIPLAAGIVAKASKKGPDRERRREAHSDMMQEAVIGLMKAADRFVLARGFRFSTYAKWWILSEVSNHITSNNSVVRSIINADQKRIFFNLSRHLSEIEKTLRSTGEYISLDQVLGLAADRMGLPAETLRSAYQRSYVGDKSLNLKLSDEEGASELIDITPSEELGPEEILMAGNGQAHAHRLIQDALAILTARERDIVQQRRLKEGAAVTLDELAKVYGITRERVRQIEVKAVSKMASLVLGRCAENHI